MYKRQPASYARQGGVIAYRLDNRKKEKIYKSMSDYLLYAKRYYGIEFSMFSFNESDLGIDVLHTPQEHADFIKGRLPVSAGLRHSFFTQERTAATENLHLKDV